MIVGLFPELSGAGGVQRAGRLTAAVLVSFAANHGLPLILLSLNDPVDAPPSCVGRHKVVYRGFNRSKLRFLRAALSAALRQPSLLIAFHPHLAPVLATMQMCAPRARWVTFAHGIEVWRPLNAIRRLSLGRSDLVLAPSADTARHLTEQQRVPAEKVRTLPWSLGPEFDPDVPRSAFPPEGSARGRVVLTVGRWDATEAYKGVDHLIQALPLLLPSVPDVRLVAIGDGSDRPRLEVLVQKIRVADHVDFLPRQKPEDLWKAYEGCDVFALPSRGEGFGLVFLEAMAHARPVIGGAHGGTPDVIDDGVTGFLVPYGDVPQLTERLQLLLTDDARRRKMGEEGLERVRRDFTFGRFSAELSFLLNGLLASST